jgi:TP901 family phage tail tape measure protein
MAKVMTIADQNVMSYEEMSEGIMELSSKTGISVNELADCVYNSISAGVETGKSLGFVEKTTRLARAGFADTGATLDVLTTIMNAYGLKAREVDNVSDMLIQTQNLGKVTVGELSSSMGKIIPTANANNVALDQLCAGYAIMTANGVACAESTTYMNSMLNELGKSGTKVSDTLIEKTGMSFAECMESGWSLADVLAVIDEAAKENGKSFSDMWGSSEAAKAGLILFKGEGEAFNDMLGEMQGCTGATDKAFETLETTSYDIGKTINEVKNTVLLLGQTLMQSLAPIISDVCEKIKSACEWFNNLDDEQKQMIFKVAAVVAAIGGLLVVIGKVLTFISGAVTAVQTLSAAFSALGVGGLLLNPIFLLIVGGIALVVWAIWGLNGDFDTFKKNWQIGWNTIKDGVANACDSVKEYFSGVAEDYKWAWEQIKTSTSSYLEEVKNNYTWAWETIKSDTTSHFESVKNNYTWAWEQIKSTVSNAITNVKDTITTTFETIKTTIQNVWTEISNFFINTWNNIKNTVTNAVNAVKTTITNVFNAVKTTITNIFNAIKTAIQNAWNAIKNTITNAVNAIKNTVTNVFNAIKSTVSNILSNLKSTAVNIFNQMKSAISNTISQIKSTIVNGFNAAVSYIKGLAGKAYTWGRDMIMGIVNGIKSAIGAVKNACSEVASTISSYLHFSVPDVGPLTTYESWMPDFMHGLAKGIRASKGSVIDQLATLSEEMKNKLNLPKLNIKSAFDTPEIKNVSRPNTTQQTESMSNLEMLKKQFEMFKNSLDNNPNNSGDIIIPVYIGGSMIDEIVVKAQDRRKLRSGGKA